MENLSDLQKKQLIRIVNNQECNAQTIHACDERCSLYDVLADTEKEYACMLDQLVIEHQIAYTKEDLNKIEVGDKVLFTRTEAIQSLIDNNDITDIDLTKFKSNKLLSDFNELTECKVTSLIDYIEALKLDKSQEIYIVDELNKLRYSNSKYWLDTYELHKEVK
jgi:hypothetical protein